ncbi:hypothetical protein [Chryseobacterium oryctis]|uniref:Uncharacterized protein n=1 Tax=Chryseobacterium oryctis TaxID=2952618 RepID=A0ABT3HRP1_9FLAO|nr:hypothetical protein [Chryseobacterium oryctis]MCW3162447.1 hypothetical protein [Chryseobacterium oryctis]
MATRLSVENKIAAIEDKGNNTALEVRDVLTELLNYTENQPFPPGQDVEFFHFWTDGNPVKDKLGNLLWYSIKGIKGQWINFTFRVEINISNPASTNNMFDNVFTFPIQNKDEKLLQYLKDIVVLNSPTVRFVIPYTISNGEQILDYPLSTSIYFSEKNMIVFDFNNIIYTKDFSELGIAKGYAFSSVSFHCPPFKLGKV